MSSPAPQPDRSAHAAPDARPQLSALVGPPPGAVAELSDGRAIPTSAVSTSAVRASGPGGQHVNKTSTAIQLRVQLDALPLSAEELARVRERLASRITDAGELLISSSSRRSQFQNRTAAIRRMVNLLDDALAIEAERIATKPSQAQHEARLQAKAQRSQRKRERSWRPSAGDL